MFDWIQHIADRLVYDVLGMEAKTHLALQEALLQLYPDGIIDRTDTRIVSKPSPYLTDAAIYIYIYIYYRWSLSIIEIDGVLKAVELQLYDGISSEKIHKMVFPLLKNTNRVQASKYSLKLAISIWSRQGILSTKGYQRLSLRELAKKEGKR